MIHGWRVESIDRSVIIFRIVYNKNTTSVGTSPLLCQDFFPIDPVVSEKKIDMLNDNRQWRRAQYDEIV